MMNKLVPKLRFKEFSGEWEENKVPIKIISGNNYPLTSYDSKGMLLIQGLNIYPNKLVLDKPIYISENYQVNKNIIIHNDDILLALNRPIINNKLKICLFNQEKAFLYQRAGILNFNKKKLFNHFLYYYLSSGIFLKQLLQELVGSDQPYIKSDLFKNTKNIFPTTEKEQQKIANCLSSLDKLIEAQNNKVEALKNHKKGLMQGLFPAEGEKEPNLRFGEFSGVWEEEIMGSVYNFFPTKSFPRDKLNYKNGAVKNIHYGDIHTKFSTLFDITNEMVPYINQSVDLSKINKESYCVEGDIIFADASEDLDDIGKSIEIINLNNVKLLSGLHTLHARQKEKKLIKGFAGHLFKSNNFRNQIKREAQGTKVLGISVRRLENITICFPENEIEQQKITDCLSSLDNRIEKQNKKIEALKNHKKGLMQQLFVSSEVGV